MSQTRIAVVLLSVGIVVALGYRLRPTRGSGPHPGLRAGKDEIVVYVVGAVQKPGVYAIPAGSRAVDAVKAAGGLTERANDAGVNLAAKMRDAEMLRVPAIGEKFTLETPPAPPPPDAQESVTPSAEVSVTPAAAPHAKKAAAATPSPDVPAAAASPSSAPIPDEARVSLNRASLKELEKVPGMTSSMARAIVGYRKGPPPRAFTTVEDLRGVTGLDGPPLHELMHHLKL